MSVNRKYIDSTGLLLKKLSEESHQNPNFQYNNNNNNITTINKPQFNINNNNTQPTSSLIPDSNRFPKKPQNYFTSNKNVPLSTTSTTINYKSISTNKIPTNYETTTTPITTTTTAAATISTVAELPETFGLPLNRSKKILPKYSTTSSSLNINNSIQQTQNELNSTNSDIQIISSQQLKITNLSESMSAPTLNLTNKQQQHDNEIEVISESFPISSSSSATSTLQNKQQNLFTKGLAKSLNLNTTNIINDDQFKDYLSKNYNMDLTVVCKPQCNFVSNISSIDQCIQQTNYHDVLLKKQQFFNKRVKLTSISSSDNNNNNNNDDDLNIDSSCKIKKQKLIVIDDTIEDSSEEAHKPWITPKLISLIKQRNLLQSKLNEQGKEPDLEMMAKFKSLRNKVTKLVKNARKEFLAKMVKEKKEKEGDLSSTTDITLNKSVSNVKSNEQLSTSASNTSTSQQLVTIPANISSYMLNLYNTFFNQYMQNYAQQKIPDPTTLPQSSDSKDGGEYDLLKQQAAFYAQQQQSIQKQLEVCLATATQQYVKDIPTSIVVPPPPPPSTTTQIQPQTSATISHTPFNINYYNIAN